MKKLIFCYVAIILTMFVITMEDLGVNLMTLDEITYRNDLPKRRAVLVYAAILFFNPLFYVANKILAHLA